METTGRILEAIRDYVARYDAIPGLKEGALAVGTSPAVVRRHVEE